MSDVVNNFSYDDKRGDSKFDLDDVKGVYNEMESDKDGLEDDIATAQEELDDAKTALEEFNDAPPVNPETTRDELQAEVDKAIAALDAAKAMAESWDEEHSDYFDDLSNFIDEVGRDHSNFLKVDGADLSEYARQMADSLESTNFSRWPYNCIDWEKAGEELSSDLTVYSFGSEEYYGIS